MGCFFPTTLGIPLAASCPHSELLNSILDTALQGQRREAPCPGTKTLPLLRGVVKNGAGQRTRQRKPAKNWLLQVQKVRTASCLAYLLGAHPCVGHSW